MNQLLSDNLWLKISRLSKSSLKRAAISYVSSAKYLKFGDGDLLICDASNEAIRAAHTDAKVLKRAFDRGAEIYSYPGLHAKVILLNDQAIIGSANVSRSSAENLVEAALLTDSPAVVTKVQSFVQELKSNSSLLTDRSLSRLLKIEVVRRGRQVPSRSSRRRISIRSSRTWIVGIHERTHEKPGESIAVDKTVARLSADLERPRSHVEDVRWVGRSRFRESCKPGDWVILIYSLQGRKTPSAVYERLPVIDREEVNGATYIYYESFKNTEKTAISWSSFKKLLKKVGINREVKPGSQIEISDQEVDALAVLWKQAK